MRRSRWGPDRSFFRGAFEMAASRTIARGPHRGRGRVRRLAAIGAILPLGVACNAIWGIDAPTLVTADGGGGDGPPADVRAADVRRQDARRDAPQPDGM